MKSVTLPPGAPEAWRQYLRDYKVSGAPFSETEIPNDSARLAANLALGVRVEKELVDFQRGQKELEAFYHKMDDWNARRAELAPDPTEDELRSYALEIRSYALEHSEKRVEQLEQNLARYSSSLPKKDNP